MNDVDELIQRRDALNQQIKRATLTKMNSFNDRLDVLCVAVRQFAETLGEPGEEHRRKNVTSITVKHRVTVKFPYQEPNYGGYLELVDTATGMRCTFDEELPTQAALIGLLAGQLGVPVTSDTGQAPT